MSAILRLFIAALAIVVAFYSLDYVHPGWLTELGPELLSLPEVRAYLRREIEYGRQLEKEHKAVLACAKAKHEVVKDLLAERGTLLESAARFRELEQTLPDGQVKRLRLVFPAGSEVERYCHEIIRAVASQLSDRPGEAAAVVARLKAELQAAVESGAFCLPE